MLFQFFCDSIYYLLQCYDSGLWWKTHIFIKSDFALLPRWLFALFDDSCCVLTETIPNLLSQFFLSSRIALKAISRTVLNLFMKIDSSSSHQINYSHPLYYINFLLQAPSYSSESRRISTEVDSFLKEKCCLKSFNDSTPQQLRVFSRNILRYSELPLN